MIQRGYGSRLAFKTLGMPVQPLDGDDAVESRVAGLVHFAPAARTQAIKEFKVSADGIAYGHRLAKRLAKSMTDAVLAALA